MKGFVFLIGAETFQRFVGPGAFSELEAEHDITYVVLRNRDIKEEADISKFFGGSQPRLAWVEFYNGRQRAWVDLYNVTCCLYQHRSSSFEARTQARKERSPGTYQRILLLAKPGTYQRFRRGLERRLGLHPDILALTLKHRPDFFVLPSSILDSLTDEVLLVAEAFGIPVLMLVAGWDGLSSKGVMARQPTMVGVWGEQTKNHAIQVQGIPPEKVRLAGAPHYESFKDPYPVDALKARKDLGVPEDGRLVLFAGAARQFDETGLLRDIDKALTEGRLPAMHVLYRPHPYRMHTPLEDNFFEVPWSNVTMDPAMVQPYLVSKRLAPKEEFKTIYDRDHLKRIYRVIDGLVCTLASVLLEALMLGIPMLAVAHGDGKHPWSADKVARMLNVREFFDAPGVLVCRRPEDFLPLMEELMVMIGQPALRQKMAQGSNFYVYQDQRSYARRAADLAREMLAQPRPAPNFDSATIKPGVTWESYEPFLPWSVRLKESIKYRLSRLTGRHN